jgi:hypothetical protein
VRFVQWAGADDLRTSLLDVIVDELKLDGPCDVAGFDATLGGEAWNESARAEIIRRLVDSSSAYEVLAEAAAIQADIEAPLSVVHTRTQWRKRVWIPVGAAASIALFALLIVRIPAGVSSLARLDGASLTLAPNWYQTGWPITRGGAPPVTAGVSFRVGVRLADLDVAMEARDSMTIQRAATGLIDVLQAVDGASPLITDIESQFAHGALTVPARTADGWLTRARDITDGRALELGVWAEQARLAAWVGSADFFTDHPINEGEFISTASAISADAGEAMRGVTTVLAWRDLRLLGEALRRLIAEAGR